MKNILGLIGASMIGASLMMGFFYWTNNSDNNQMSTQIEPLVQRVNHPPVVPAHSIDFTGAAAKTVDAVVHVKVRSKVSSYDNSFYNFLFGRPSQPTESTPIVSTGSGVIISNDGYIVTNNHVIEGADALDITLHDRRTLSAKVVGTDKTTDIALIKIEGEDFPFIPWGDSDELKVGEWVLAVGNPFNLASTVTAGIVSAKARNINIMNRRTAIEAFIQTDAAVNPGNSGGALVNTEGELVGINTAIASPTGSFSGYSFAVPQRIAQKVVGDLIEFGSIQRAFIGINIADVTSTVAKQAGVNSTQGVYVSGVNENGAAKQAGIKTGDIILEVAGVKVNQTAELQEQVSQYRPGDEIAVVVKRGKSTKKLLLVLRNIDGNTELKRAGEKEELYGAKLSTIKASETQQLRINGGVQVSDIQDGKFKDAGIKEGFIITSVNRARVYTVEDLQMVLQNSRGGIYIEGVYPNGISAYYAFGI